MSEKVEIVLHRKGDLRKDRLPAEWRDPEGLAVIPPHHLAMFLDNPVCTNDEDPVRAYAVVDDCVAGRLSLIPSEIFVDSVPVPVLWGFDLLVSSRFRGRGLAIKLIQCWQDAYPTAMGTHVNLPSVGIYRKFGWVEFNTPTFVTAFRSRKFVEGYIRPRLLAAVVAPIVDAGLSARRALGGGGAASELRAEAVSALSDEHDSALARSSSPAATHRSGAWINWQMQVGEADEGSEYRLCYVKDRDGQPVGYFILQLKTWPTLRDRFENVRLGSLRDWGIFDDGKVDLLAICLLATREARGMGADAAMVTVPDEAAAAALHRLGFRGAEPLMTLFHAAPDSPLSAEKFRDSRAWRFTPAEADGLVV